MEERRRDNLDTTASLARIEERVDSMFKRLFGSEEHDGGVIGSHARRITFLEKIVWMGLGILTLLRMIDVGQAVKVVLGK